VVARRGDELIELLRAGPVDAVEADRAANELLNQIFDGYPVQNLRRLIRSDEDQAVKAGAWVVSELGAGAAEVLDEVDYLLRHPVRDARFFALDAVLAAASSDHGAMIATAIMLITDQDQAVRRKALRLLARASTGQLAAAVRYKPDSRAASLAAWLVSYAGDQTHRPEVLVRLGDSDRETRLFAAAAAVRLADRDRAPLERAAESDDPDIRLFAQDELAIMRRRSG
jgi:hypothetical protein